MFKPALKLVVRLLPFMAAMVASVAIGASTQAPEAVPANSAALDGPVMMASSSLRSVDAMRSVVAGSNDVTLLARADTLDLLATAYPVGSLDTALTVPAPKVVSRVEARSNFEWPRPDRWTSLLATLALVAFFFLRRLV